MPHPTIIAAVTASVLVLAGCASSSESVAPDPKPEVAASSVGIVNGTEAKAGQFPWMVSVQFAPANIVGLPLCGGVAVAPTWVLSAKHCHTTLGTRTAKNWRIRANSLKWAKGGETIRVAKFVDYPDPNVDLSLLKLATPTSAPNIAVPPPGLTDPYKVGAEAIAMGWGTAKDGSLIPSATLKWVRQVTAANDTCKGGENGVFCGGQLNNAGAGTCQFDSGGPYVWSTEGFAEDGTPQGIPYVAGTLRGLFNETCGTPGKNDDWAATNSTYSTWITSIIGTQ